ncbi:MAG: PD40 domain-containing protein [Phycisphaerae bacterium]|nr:PD40 domain-containing protein [Phycisphaerae bacterium]
MIEQMNNTAEMWWAWMWPMFWQVGVLIALIAGIDLLIRRRVWPQVRYALWLLVLAKLILPPTFSLSTSVTSSLEPLAEQIVSVRVQSEVGTTLPYIDVSSAPIVIPQHGVQAEPTQQRVNASEGPAMPTNHAAPTVQAPKLSAKGWAMCVWLLGVVALSVWLAARFRQLRRTHSARADGAVLPRWLGESLSESADKLKLHRLPRVSVSRDVASPAVFGVIRPTLLLPSHYLAKGLQKDTEHVLLHELAHIQRRDLWVHAVYMVLQIVYWFNPLLWFVRRHLQHLRELCCDASVARVLREETCGYRQTILDTARRLLAKPVEPGIGLLGLFEDSSRLLIRLKWLEKKTWRYRTLRIMIILTLIAFMCVCVLPMAKGGSDVQMSAQELVAKIIESEKKIRDIQLRMTCTIPAHNQTFYEYDWGYERGKEFYSGIDNTRDSRTNLYRKVEVTRAFDGAREWQFRNDPKSSRPNGGISEPIPNFSFSGGIMTFNTLLGYDAKEHRRLSLGEAIDQAESISVRDEVEFIDGRHCHVIEAVNLEANPSGHRAYDVRVWIDSRRDYRPLKFEKYLSIPGKNRFKAISRRVHNVKLKQIDGIWLPIEGERTTFSTNDIHPPEGMTAARFGMLHNEKRRRLGVFKLKPMAPTRRLEIDVESIRLNKGIPPKTFTIDFPEGCEVYNEFAGNRYIVGEQSEKDAVLSDSELIEQTKKLPVRDMIEILRRKGLGLNKRRWFAAVYCLVDVGSPAVPQLVAEVRQTQTPITQSKLALTLGAIGDANAVPGLIDALERSGFSSDYGIGTARTELERFYQMHQIDSAKEGLGLGRPVREITIALERLTGHSEGHDHFDAYDSAGNRLGGYTITPEIRDRQRQHRRRVAQKWRTWWQANKDNIELTQKPLTPPGEAMAGGVEAEIQVLEALLGRIEALCVPAKGTLRHAVERRYGKGIAVNSADDLSEVDNPASTYWVYEFCENGTLLVCYDGESLAEVEWVRYIESYPVPNRSRSLMDEEKLRLLKLRQEQMVLIFAEHTKRFGEDTNTAWGKAADDVRVRIRADMKSWPVGSDPSFQFDIENEGNRTLFIAYPQSCKVEVDGKWHTANYTAYGYPRSIGTGGRMTYSVLLGDFLSDGAERLSAGKHTIRAALFHIGERDESSADEKTPIRFGARKFEAISNPVEIEVAPTPEEDATRAEPGTRSSSVVASEASREMNRNWPSFRGPGGAGISTHANIPTSWDGNLGKGVLWKSPVPLGGHNSPIVWDGRVFVSGGKGNELEVYCFDASSGRRLWTGSVPMTRPRASEKFEVMEDVGLAAPTMATDGRRVCAIFATGDLGCFDFHGKRLWTKSLGIPDNVYGHASSLSMYRNLVIVQFDQARAEDGKSKIIAFDTASGLPVWETNRPVANSWASPIVAKIDGKDAIITCADPWVIAYDPASGSELWRAECLAGDLAASPIYANGLTFVVEPYNKIAAIRTNGKGNVTKTHIAWSVDEPGPDICSPVSNGEYVFILNSDGLALCFNAADGKKLWEEDIRAGFLASPSLVGDKLYLLSEKGVMIIAEAMPKYKELKRCELGEKCHASPAFADGRIYIRGQNSLYCIGEAESSPPLPHPGDEAALGGKDDELDKANPAVQGENSSSSVVRVNVLDHQGEPVEGATVELQLFAGGDVDDEDKYSIHRGTTDANGLFVFEEITAVSGHIGREFACEDGSARGVPYALSVRFEIEPGKDYNITLGGKGRPVIGRLVPASGNDGDIDWSKAWADFDLRAAPFSMGFWEYNAKIVRAMLKAEGGNFYRNESVEINPDGTFRIDSVRAGRYMLRVKVIEEPKREGFNLFREIRIPLMPDGATDKPFNLGTLAVSHGAHKAPRYADNLFLGSLEFGKDIPVILKAGNNEQPDVVSARGIRFAKDGNSLTAALDIEWRSVVADRWRARLKLLSENGSYLAWDDVFFETSKIIRRFPALVKETLSFSLGEQSNLSRIPHFMITIEPVSEILTGSEPSATGVEISRPDEEGVRAGEFTELSVKFGGIWIHWQGVEFTIKGDGSAEFSMNKGPNDKTRYRTTFKLRREHFAQLSGLLEKTSWLTAPGANEQPGYTDATRIDISLTRDDTLQKVWCHDRNPEPYLSLINFLKRIYRQEFLLNRMVAAGDRERASAFYEISQQIRAQKGEPIAANPNHVLDLNRFVPPSIDVIAHPDDNHYERITTALKLLAMLHTEQARGRITELTTAVQKERGPSGAQYCTEVVRSAAVEALITLGGEQARLHIRDMAAKHVSWQRQVNEALVESLLKLDRDNCVELLKNMVPKTKKAGWGLIRLGSAAMPAILEILESRDLRDMGQIYLIRQYIDNWENVAKPIDGRVIEAVQRNLDYRLGYSRSWTEYHRELLKLAGAAELPSKDARQITEEFLAAVKANDQTTIRAVANPVQGNWSERLPELRKLPELKQLRLIEVYADTTENMAQAIAVGPDPDHKDSPRVRIFLNFISGSVWRIRNISIDTPEIADRMTRRFLEKYPNARPVPAKSTVPAVKLDQQINVEKPTPVWGEPVAGVQARLYGYKSSWREDEIPRFQAGVRNNGSEELFARWTQDDCRLEVDGQWHSWSGRTTAELMPLSAGKKLDHIFILLSSLWRTVDGRELRFTPGKHTVSLAVPAFRDKGQVLPAIQPISNPVRIEITPVGDIELVWGEEVNGLRAAVEFLPDKPQYSFGEKIDLRFHIQNVSDRTIQFISEAWRQDNDATIEDRDGNMQTVPGTWYSGVGPIDRYYLKPGEKVVIDSYDLGIARDRKQAKQLKHPVGYRLRCEPGVYYARFGLRLPGVGSSLLPAEDADFKGTLETGPRKFTVTAKPLEEESELPVSRKGKLFKRGKIAFVSRRDGNQEIYIMNTDGSEQRRLTNNPAEDKDPAWSPDGRRIAFRSKRDGNGEIYLMNTDGSGQTNLTDHPGYDGDYSWSPDGKRIAFARYSMPGAGEVFVINADGAGLRQLTTMPALYDRPCWSPDGSKLALPVRYGIDIVNSDGTGRRVLINHDEFIGSPTWSPDGRMVAFEKTEDNKLDLYVIGVDGKGLRRLTSRGSDDVAPYWLPDGKGIAAKLDSWGEGFEIFAIGIDDAKERRLTRNRVGEVDFSWSPDRNRIAFSAIRGINHAGADGNLEIYVVDTNTGEQTNLTNHPAHDEDPAWSPNL